MVDTYYYNKKLPQGAERLPLMYWGKYVQHDNNRDGMGQYPEDHAELHHGHPGMAPHHPARSARSAVLSLRLHRHRPVQRLARPHRRSTNGGCWPKPKSWKWPSAACPASGPTAIYDGWVPNYLFWIALTHNSFGRFYEVQSYGPDVQPNLQLGATATSREWYRPNPPLPSIKWGPRNNTNIQESALLIAMQPSGQEPRAVSGELLR